MAKPGTTNFARIGTHPHAESQCRAYIAKNYPHAEIVPTNSTSAAAELVSKGELDAAIASSVAASHFGLALIAEDIGDNTGAVTRFICAQKPGWVRKESCHRIPPDRGRSGG